MAIQDTWLSNLKALVDAEGGGRKGIRSVADIAGLSEEYVYQLVANKPKKDGTPRFVGKDAANKVSIAFANGRPSNWFDLPSPPTDPIASDTLINALQDWRLQASAKSQEVIDQLTLLAKKNMLRDEDWLLIEQITHRIARK